MDAVRDLFLTGYGWEFIFRYIHFLAGVMWIGVLWYFNLIQTPFFATDLGGEAKSAMTRGLVPNALWWFRWGAMFTFLSGWLLILMYIGMGGMSLGDGLMTRILTGGLMGTLMWFNVWFIIWPAQRDYAIQSALNVAEGKDQVPGTPEKSVLVRDARPASGARAAASGIGSPPPATCSALAMATFWIGQITNHTLNHMKVPIVPPVRTST